MLLLSTFSLCCHRRRVIDAFDIFLLLLVVVDAVIVSQDSHHHDVMLFNPSGFFLERGETEHHSIETSGNIMNLNLKNLYDDYLNYKSVIKTRTRLKSIFEIHEFT